jgi:glyoxylase-like metal-dependent hydrolase (beta-lactamase superfamily II)
MRVGDISIEPVYDGTAILTTDMFAGSDWTDHEHLLDASGRLTVPVGGFLVRSGGRLALLDLGVGHLDDPMFDGGEFLTSLAALGVSPGEIDTIVISHLHSDHMGWVETDGGPTFENATIRVAAADWQYFVEEGNGGRKRTARLRAIEERVELLHGDEAEVFPGVTTRATPGHTPGHTSAVIASGTERLIVLGDALHCPAQLTETEWEFFYDVDRELAKRTRQTLLREAEAESTSLLPCHFPGMQAARLVAANGSRSWTLY